VKQITIHDIAKKLKISSSTVSRALQNSDRVSLETRKKVNAIAKELNYSPNTAAANLRKGLSNTVGIIVPRINRHFFSEVIGGIEQTLNTKGFSVIACQTHENYDLEVQNVKTLINLRVAAIFVSLSAETKEYSHYKLINEKNISLIMFDRVCGCEDIFSHKIILNDFKGAYQATKHLIERGCKRIAHLAGPMHINVYKNRYEGYIKALKDNNIQIYPELIINNCLTKEKGYEYAYNLFNNKIIPDAVFGASDYSTLGAMMRAKDLNIKIPEDVAFVGFANEPFTEFMHPSLSSIEQYPNIIGHEAANIFIELIKNKELKNISKTLYIEPELIIRESSK
jgi:LacI family transcriptional regulator